MLLSHIPRPLPSIGLEMTKDRNGLGDLTESVRNLNRRAEQTSKKAKEMIRQVQSLKLDMKQTEAGLRAAKRTLQRTKRKADRVHRHLRRQSTRAKASPGLLLSGIAIDI